MSIETTPIKTTKETDQKELQYNPKKHTKVALVLLLFTWFILAFLLMFSSVFSAMTTVVMGGVGLALGGAISFSLLGVIGNPAFWNSFESIERVKQDYREFKAKYQKALTEFVNNQKINKDE